MILETTYQSTFGKIMHAKTAPHIIDTARFLPEQLQQASPELMGTAAKEGWLGPRLIGSPRFPPVLCE